MDDLTVMLASSSVAPPNSTTGEHPRFSLYKNLMKAEASQAKRRGEYLRRQKEARFNYANHARNLAMNMFDDEEDEEGEEVMDVGEGSVGKGKRSKGRRSRNRYADELMLSEWLVDIPDTLSTDWICLPCPLGKRALVVASNGVTSAYSKSGYLIKQFSSYLPGGSRSSCSTFHYAGVEVSVGCTHYTLLDCVFSPEQLTFYCLDMIAWNDSAVADSDFECRLFLLNSRISENENFKEVSKQFPYRFLCLPSCRCVKSSMEELMRTEFPFELDGVLFYYAGVLYRSGQSPLVGWLKPWMLPEILSVEIPPSLMKGNESTKGAAQKFIDDYNSKHRRPSMKEMPTTTATKRPVDVAIES
ncbi:unnamed protein product [Toxocara canis]|uniref:Snurportin-1 n=1 Tax=Toxocara canis TaxID=6265 RepID=A0A183UWM6_TOXCA|nr:unnamed protein product [Toxocara canis]